MVGSLHLHIFARVYRVSSGSDQGRFRWYLNDVPASAGVQLQGIVGYAEEGSTGCQPSFPAMAQAGWAYRKPCARQEADSPSPSPELSVREWQADAEDKASCQIVR